MSSSSEQNLFPKKNEIYRTYQISHHNLPLYTAKESVTAASHTNLHKIISNHNLPLYAEKDSVTAASHTNLHNITHTRTSTMTDAT